MSSIINSLTLEPALYQSADPYPYGIQDNILREDFGIALQKEILDLPADVWDRYDNPFEQKLTLRDKWNFPPLLSQLFDELQAPEFVARLSEITGWDLRLDTTRNFWGVHTYKTGDKLDIHVDAGQHPAGLGKKQVTLGIYLSANWREEYGCELEVWRGTSAADPEPRLIEKVASIAPLFNRLILFNCNDVAWHGNPEPASCPEDARRIFVTISYLSDNDIDRNKKVKALFVARPSDEFDEEKDKLRLLRADPERYKDIYRIIS